MPSLFHLLSYHKVLFVDSFLGQRGEIINFVKNAFPAASPSLSTTVCPSKQVRNPNQVTDISVLSARALVYSACTRQIYLHCSWLTFSSYSFCFGQTAHFLTLHAIPLSYISAQSSLCSQEFRERLTAAAHSYRNVSTTDSGRETQAWFPKYRGTIKVQRKTQVKISLPRQL